jgi:hypothetical protein
MVLTKATNSSQRVILAGIGSTPFTPQGLRLTLHVSRFTPHVSRLTSPAP